MYICIDLFEVMKSGIYKRKQKRILDGTLLWNV